MEQTIGVYSKNNIQRGLAFLVLAVAVTAAYLLLPASLGSDWMLSFRPAAQNALSGRSPYEIDQFFIAPWSLLLFVPLSLLPAQLGMAVLVVGGVCAYAYVAIRLGAKPVGLAAILLSPQVLHNLINGNVDWLAFLGFVMPPQIGLFFLAIKPQIGLALALYWAVEAWQAKKFLRTFGMFLTALAVSFFLFGLWPLSFSSVQPEYNASAWPVSLPFGLVLAISAIYRRRERIAQAISPLLSPHVMFHSWATMIFALAPNTVELVTAVVVSWGVVLWAVFAMG